MMTSIEMCMSFTSAWSQRACWSDPVPVTLVLDVAPHLASVLTPAVHRWPYRRNTWQVSCMETGQLIGQRHGTRTKALQAACSYLANRTVADIEAAYIRAPQWVRD